MSSRYLMTMWPPRKFHTVGLPFLVNDHVDAERAEVDITDGAYDPVY